MRQTDALVPERRVTTPTRQKAVGIGCMVLAIVLFTLMDSIAKTLTATYAVPRVVCGRYTFHLVVVLTWAPWLGRELFRTRYPIMQVGRGLLLAFGTLFMVSALSFIPLANAYTVTFVAPFLVTRIVSRGAGESPFAMSFYLALMGTLTTSALVP